MSFLNTLVWWQWLTLGAIFTGVVLLYFLKLRRRPVEVPSTYLWSRTLEDLHVNSIWQRLRRNLLLFLQLLTLALLALALLRPGFRTTKLVGDRFILLIDTSASMRAVDVAPSRLEEAKRRAEAVIDAMQPGQTAMILSSSNQSRVEQTYTDNRRLLKARLRAIQPTYRTSDIEEALRYADGLANPGRSASDATDVQVAEPMPATIYLLSDGGFTNVPNFFLGHLTPIYMPIGNPAPRNVGIMAFTAERNVENPRQTQAYGRLENFGPDPEEVEVTLYFDGRLVDATRVTIPSGGTEGVEFELRDVESGVLELRCETVDDLAADNQAFAAVNAPRKARVLLVTPGNDSIQLALTTEEAEKVSDLLVAEPAFLQSDAYRQSADAGDYDLVIYDRCVPERMPLANTFFIGGVPPNSEWKLGSPQGPPIIVDTDRSHPIMQLVEMGDVKIVEGRPVTVPPGGRSLMDADIGCLLAIAPRDSFEDCVLGFDIVTTNEGSVEINTNWPIRRGYPVFCMNLLRYLGGARSALALPSVPPGNTLSLSTTAPTDRLFVTTPSGRRMTVSREATGSFSFTDTEELGAYEVRESEKGPVTQRFTVNLFNRRESDLRPESEVKLEYESIKATASAAPVRFEAWRWILLLALIVVMVEWYVYNRRVYI